MAQFNYSPLQTSTSIRILRLEAGHYEDPLEGHLYNFELHDPRKQTDRYFQGFLAGFGMRVGIQEEIAPYEALSYVWGEPLLSSTVSCPDGDIAITQNLDEALRRVRFTNLTRMIWADGVCIDQSNLRERGHQVKMMGLVYARARRVLVWLGPDHEQKASSTFGVLRSQSKYDKYLVNSATVNSAIRAIFRQEWFSRTWVVQEFLLSRVAQLLWGCEIYEYDDPLRRVMAAYLETLRFSARHWITLPRSNTRFLEVLGCMRSASCSDERDRIYSVLGLRYDMREPLSAAVKRIEPDYTTPIGLLFFKVACLCIREFEIQDLVANVACNSDPLPTILELPSWVPDWSRASRHCPIDRENLELKPKSTFSLVSVSPETYHPRINERDRVLSVVGIRVTTIHATMHKDLDPDCIPETIEAVFSFWHRVIRPYRKYLDETKYARMEIQFVAALAGHWNCDRHKYSVDDLAHQLFGEPKWSNKLIAMVNRSTHAIEMLSSLTTSANLLTEPTYAFHRLVSGCARRFWRGRRPFQTKHGFIGLGPSNLRRGDTVALLSGSSLYPIPFPVVLRHYRSVAAWTRQCAHPLSE